VPPQNLVGGTFVDVSTLKVKLGFEGSEATVSRYMPRRKKPPPQTWRSFLRNHTLDLVSIDFFVVPTAAFRVLYVFLVLVLEHERRRVVHFNVTHAPSAQWTGQQLEYYHSSRTHLALDKDARELRERESSGGGEVVALPMVGELHHRYTRRVAA